MAELKRVFSKATMNKDVDERLVPNGQYRDANNIEIATSEGSNVGTVQTILSNLERNLIDFDPAITEYATQLIGENTWNAFGPHKRATVVGCISDPAKDKIYYLVSAGDESDTSSLKGSSDQVDNYANNYAKDYIVEYDTVEKRARYVFVDIFRVHQKVDTSNTTIGETTFHITGGNGGLGGGGVRIGMNLVTSATEVATNSDANLVVTSVLYDETPGMDGNPLDGSGRWRITTNLPHGLNDNDVITFQAPRILEFSKHRIITGINILEDMLFWTDGVHEPKKINIPRSIAGTGGYIDLGTGMDANATDLDLESTFLGDTDYFHTRLTTERPSYEGMANQYQTAWREYAFTDAITGAQTLEQFPIYTTKDHVTVIRKGPTQPLELDMYRTAAKRVTSSGVETPSVAIILDYAFLDPDNTSQPIQVDQTAVISFVEDVDYRIDDIILIASGEYVLGPNSFTEHSIRARVVASPVTNPNLLANENFVIEILSIQEGMSIVPGDWYVKLEDKRPMFENKFPRFSYRYKYSDGEYSTFAPWSQIAFLPDVYEYFPKKGYNLGMVNQVRSLRLKYYFYDQDTLPQDVVEIDLLYKEAGKPNVYTVKTIKPTDNSLEWPNLQNDFPPTLDDFLQTFRGRFDMTTDMVHALVPDDQILRPWDNVPRNAKAQEISANRLIYGNYLQNYTVFENPIIHVGYDASSLENYDYAEPSVKTMRKYQVGVVFSDGYGRETPVLTTKNATIEVPKDQSDTRNRITCHLDEATDIPSWAKYFSYYIKEPTVEYYTMAMDRWYSAADGNIWLSFPSSERNKLDNETFLVLKKAHGTNQAVKDKARYRILAIENEAPDFIKTERKVLGRIYDNGSGAVIGNGGSGFPSQDATYIDFPYDSWIENFGDQIHITQPDSLAIRFYGGNVFSNDYEVSQVAALGSGPETFRVTLTNRIEEDAEFISEDDTIATVIGNLSMELIELEVENRPEFDGRFFVKIHKDETLEQYVLNSQVIEYSVAANMEIGYLNNNGYSGVDPSTGEVLWDTTMINAGGADDVGSGSAQDYYDNAYSTQAGTAAGSVSGSYNHVTGLRNVAGTPLHPTEYAHHSAPEDIGGQGQFTYWWGSSQNTGPNEAPGAIDNPGTTPYNDGQSRESHGIWCNQIDNNSIAAINDSTGAGSSPVQENDSGSNFWNMVLEERTLFIDASTAYSWTGRGMNSIGQRPGAQASLGQTDLFDSGPQASEGIGFEGAGTEAVGNNPNIDQPSNTNPKMGQPSRGIWHHESEDISYIDLSWSGMGNIGNVQQGIWPGDGNGSPNGGWSDATDAIGIFHKIANVDCEDAETQLKIDQTWDFLQQLTAPGTMFRFGRDPDEQIYTVLAEPFPTIVGNSFGPGYGDTQVFSTGSGALHGVWGIRNYRPDWLAFVGNREQYGVANLRQRWTIAVTPRIGQEGGPPAEYSPVKGTGGRHLNTATGLYGGDGPAAGTEDYRRALWHDLTGARDTIEILQVYSDSATGGNYTNNPGIWETEPKETVDLDIYYQASGLIPLELNQTTDEELIPVEANNIGGTTFKTANVDVNGDPIFTTHTVTKCEGNIVTFSPAIPPLAGVLGDTQWAYVTGGGAFNGHILFTKRNSYSFTARQVVLDFAVTGDTTMALHGGVGTQLPEFKLFSQKHYLDWNNCWCFGNGVESDRIRDDFNATQMDNGVKASSVIAEQVREERRKHGMIWSGIYNSMSGINETNQFIAAKKITKDLNPVYGSIQALLNRDTRLIMFCEDKILRGVTNKDALYNADGNPQLVASNAVIGDVTPYQGEYGISKNPESLAVTPSTVYFSDVMRGKVLALFDNGLQVISDAGMKDYFSDYMASYVWRSLGTYDCRKKEYNLTLSKKYANYQIQPHDQTTVSYSELSKGWISFKSFYPQNGVSLNNNYYTFSSGSNNSGSLYEHYAGTTRNTFYELASTSDITLLFNDSPELIKGFSTLNYEGSQAKIPVFASLDNQNYFTGDYSTNQGLIDTDGVTDGEYFNLTAKTGWYADNLITNMQSCDNVYFKSKEKKYYGYPTGDTTLHSSGCGNDSVSNLDEAEFSVQGIGLASITHDTPTQGDAITVTIANRTATTDGWDTALVVQQEILHWTCDEQVLCVVGGATIGSVTVNLTVTSIIDGVFTGYPLSAANFEIGEYGSVLGNVYTIDGDSNVTDVIDIDTVTFSDNGTAGDPQNTLNVAVTFHSDQTWPTADYTYYIDIDEKVDAPTVSTRSFCLQTQYAYWGEDPTMAGLVPGLNSAFYFGGPHTETGPTIAQVSDLPVGSTTDISETVLQPGTFEVNTLGYYAPEEPTLNLHNGTVENGTQSLVAEIKFHSNLGLPDFALVPSANYPQGYVQGTYFTGTSGAIPHVSFENLGPYEGSYVGDVVDVSWAEIGENFSPVIQGFTARVFYTPPPEEVLPDWPDMCQLNPGPHKAIVNFRMKHQGQGVAGSEPSLFTVICNQNLPFAAKTTAVKVLGKAGTTYKIRVQEKTSLTNSVTKAGGYYNFKNRVFENTDVSEVYTIGALGTNAHTVSLPGATADTRYDVTVEPLLQSNGEPAIASHKVPTKAGDCSMVKRGVRTLTLTPTTATVSNFGLLPTQAIVKPKKYANDNYNIGGLGKRIEVYGGNSNVSSTKINMKKGVRRIEKDMLVMTPFNSGIIPHNTKVVSVQDNLVVLNNAVALDNSTRLTFIKNSKRIVPFSLTIPHGSGKVLSLKSDVEMGNVISGLGTATSTLTSATTTSTTINLASVRGIKSKHVVRGTGVVADPEYGYLRVESVNHGTNSIVVSTAQTIADETSLTFNYPEEDTLLPDLKDIYGGSNRGIKPLHIQASLSDGDLLVEGYLDAKSVQRTDTLDIHIDDFVTVK